MKRIIKDCEITEPIITRINYLEILAGASENAEIHIRKSLNRFAILEFDSKAVQIGNTLAVKYRVSSKQSNLF